MLTWAQFDWGYMRSPPIKSTNQQGCIKTSRENRKEPSPHFAGQYSSSGQFLAIAAKMLLSVVRARAATARATGIRVRLQPGLYPQASSAMVYGKTLVGACFINVQLIQQTW